MISSFSNAQLLTMWERAAAQPTARRAICLLAGAGGEPDLVAALTIGERDRQLLLLRRELFGDHVEGMTECPSCGSRVEVRFSVTNIAEKTHVVAAAETTLSNGFAVRWRLPTSGELAALTDEKSPERLRERLLELCVLGVWHEDREIACWECPRSVIHDVCAAMSQADPYGDIRLGVNCPVCRNAWEVMFDISSYLWREIDVWARRLLREIHSLASVYGWSEREILAMPVQRRTAYLELVGA